MVGQFLPWFKSGLLGRSERSSLCYHPVKQNFALSNNLAHYWTDFSWFPVISCLKTVSSVSPVLLAHPPASGAGFLCANQQSCYCFQVLDPTFDVGSPLLRTLDWSRHIIIIIFISLCTSPQLEPDCVLWGKALFRFSLIKLGPD